jgi:predicted MPP superfamily phosphohydrolase
MSRMTRRSFLKLAGGMALGLATGQLALNTYRFEVSRHTLLLPLSAPVKIVQLSDLHYGPLLRQGSVSAWVEATRLEHPDLILITGDFVDRFTDEELTPLVSALSQLSAPLGVWGVWGNHDHFRFRPITSLLRPLQEAGITILNNRGVALRDDLYLAGVDDFRTGYPDLAAAIGGRPKGATCLLMSHNPDMLPLIPAEVDLVLCGHTHGGQVNFPLIGAPLTSSHYGQRFRAGWVEAPARAYVSRGLGVTMLPLRLNCPPELAVFELRAS